MNTQHRPISRQSLFRFLRKTELFNFSSRLTGASVSVFFVEANLTAGFPSISVSAKSSASSPSIQDLMVRPPPSSATVPPLGERRRYSCPTSSSVVVVLPTRLNSMAHLSLFCTTMSPYPCWTVEIVGHGDPLSKSKLGDHGFQFATIRPGNVSCVRSASCARWSRFGNLTCSTSRKTGAATTPRPVFDRHATARSLVFSQPSATSRLGPLQCSHSPGVIPVAARGLAHRWRRDRQPETVLRADQRAGVLGADDHRRVRPDELCGVQAFTRLRQAGETDCAGTAKPS